MAALAAPDADLKYRLLLDISQKISRTLDLNTSLNLLLESVRTAIAYDAAGIFVLNRTVPLAPHPENYMIAGMATTGFEDLPRDSDPMLRSGRGIVGHVISTGESVIAGDVRRDPRYVAGRASTLSEMAVPIVSNSAVIGALNIESDRLDAFSSGDLELLEFFANAAAISIEKALLHRQVLEKQRMENQLRVAQEIQAGLLPGAAPEVPGYDIAGVNISTWEIGGDYFDYLPLSGGRLGVVVADVSGKGVPAALVMAGFRAALHTELRKDEDIREALQNVNRMVVHSTEVTSFVTVIYGVLEPDSGLFTYALCGHNPPFVLRADGRMDLLEEAGLPLGMFDDFECRLATIPIESGDALVLYTDGVVEIVDANRVEFGTQRLGQVLRDCADRTVEEAMRAVVKATRAFAGRDAYEDDFTLVVVRRR